MPQPQQVDPNAGKAPENEFLDLNPPQIEEETPEIEAQPEAPSEDAKAAEVEARSNGWVSKDEWVENHGSEKGWKSAEDYVDFRRNFLPILSKENKELRKQVTEMATKLAERERREQEAEATLARERLKYELKAAREDGDRDREDEIIDKMLDLKVAAKTAPAAPVAPAVNPEVEREVLDFQARNPWFNTDHKLSRVFTAQVGALKQADPAMGVTEVLNEAKDIVRRMYPEKFPSGRRTAMAEAGGESNATRVNGQRSWADVKPEYREAYNDRYFEMNPEIKRENVLRRLPADAFRR